MGTKLLARLARNLSSRRQLKTMWVLGVGGEEERWRKCISYKYMYIEEGLLIWQIIRRGKAVKILKQYQLHNLIVFISLLPDCQSIFDYIQIVPFERRQSILGISLILIPIDLCINHRACPPGIPDKHGVYD